MKLTGKLKVQRLEGHVNIVAGRPSGDLQAKTVKPSRQQQIVEPDSGYAAMKRVTVEAVSLQDKTVEPGTAVKVVTADGDHTGLGTVTVDAAPLQLKEVAPTTAPQEVTPDPGFYGLEKVTVGAVPLQELTVEAMYEQQTIEPEEGFLGFSRVIVAALEDDGGSGGDFGGDDDTGGGDGSGDDGGDTGGGDSGGDSGGTSGGSSSSSLPIAENYSFGGTMSSYGFGDDTSVFNGKANSGSTYCNVFTAQTNFNVIGFRVPGGHNYNINVYIWDMDKNLLSSGKVMSPVATTEWGELYLTDEIPLVAGCEYVVGVYSASKTMKKAKKNTVQTNEKINLTKYGSESGSKAFPSSFMNLATSSTSGGEIAPVDIIIGDFDNLPDTYQVSADTMNRLAAAVQTFAGVTHSMTPEQMVSTLEST